MSVYSLFLFESFDTKLISRFFHCIILDVQTNGLESQKQAMQMTTSLTNAQSQALLQQVTKIPSLQYLHIEYNL